MEKFTHNRSIDKSKSLNLKLSSVDEVEKNFEAKPGLEEVEGKDTFKKKEFGLQLTDHFEKTISGLSAVEEYLETLVAVNETFKKEIRVSSHEIKTVDFRGLVYGLKNDLIDLLRLIERKSLSEVEEKSEPVKDSEGWEDDWEFDRLLKQVYEAQYLLSLSLPQFDELDLDSSDPAKHILGLMFSKVVKDLNWVPLLSSQYRLGDQPKLERSDFAQDLSDYTGLSVGGFVEGVSQKVESFVSEKVKLSLDFVLQKIPGEQKKEFIKKISESSGKAAFWSTAVGVGSFVFASTAFAGFEEVDISWGDSNITGSEGADGYDVLLRSKSTGESIHFCDYSELDGLEGVAPNRLSEEVFNNEDVVLGGVNYQLADREKFKVQVTSEAEEVSREKYHKELQDLNPSEFVDLVNGLVGDQLSYDRSIIDSDPSFSEERYKRINKMPLDDLYNGGAGVCRHYAALVESMGELLLEDGRIDKCSGMVIDEVSSHQLNHAWNMFGIPYTDPEGVSHLKVAYVDITTYDDGVATKLSATPGSHDSISATFLVKQELVSIDDYAKMEEFFEEIGSLKEFKSYYYEVFFYYFDKVFDEEDGHLFVGRAAKSLFKGVDQEAIPDFFWENANLSFAKDIFEKAKTVSDKKYISSEVKKYWMKVIFNDQENRTSTLDDKLLAHESLAFFVGYEDEKGLRDETNVDFLFARQVSLLKSYLLAENLSNQDFADAVKVFLSIGKSIMLNKNYSEALIQVNQKEKDLVLAGRTAEFLTKAERAAGLVGTIDPLEMLKYQEQRLFTLVFSSGAVDAEVAEFKEYLEQEKQALTTEELLGFERVVRLLEQYAATSR